MQCQAQRAPHPRRWLSQAMSQREDSIAAMKLSRGASQNKAAPTRPKPRQAAPWINRSRSNRRRQPRNAGRKTQPELEARPSTACPSNNTSSWGDIHLRASLLRTERSSRRQHVCHPAPSTPQWEEATTPASGPDAHHTSVARWVFRRVPSPKGACLCRHPCLLNNIELAADLTAVRPPARHTCETHPCFWSNVLVSGASPRANATCATPISRARNADRNVANWQRSNGRSALGVRGRKREEDRLRRELQKDEK